MANEYAIIAVKSVKCSIVVIIFTRNIGKLVERAFPTWFCCYYCIF